MGRPRKLSDEDVLFILASQDTAEKLAGEYAVSVQLIKLIRKNKGYKTKQ